MTFDEFKTWLENKEPSDECWSYPGTTPGFYFAVTIEGRGQQKVHRLALEVKLGRRIERGKLALHSCHNKHCINKNHLYEGTYGDNQRDRWANDPDSYKEVLAAAHAGYKEAFQNDPKTRTKIHDALERGRQTMKKRRFGKFRKTKQ
jgi:hypothetical protein